MSKSHHHKDTHKESNTHRVPPEPFSEIAAPTGTEAADAAPGATPSPLQQAAPPGAVAGEPPAGEGGISLHDVSLGDDKFAPGSEREVMDLLVKLRETVTEIETLRDQLRDRVAESQPRESDRKSIPKGSSDAGKLTAAGFRKLLQITGHSDDGLRDILAKLEA